MMIKLEGEPWKVSEQFWGKGEGHGSLRNGKRKKDTESGMLQGVKVMGRRGGDENH